MTQNNTSPEKLTIERVKPLATYADVIADLTDIQEGTTNPATRARAAIQKEELIRLQNQFETVNWVGTMLDGYLKFVAANDVSFWARVFLDERKVA